MDTVIRQSMNSEFLQKLITPAQTKIAMLIMDGLGGLPREPGGLTELETARTPNLDALARAFGAGAHRAGGPGDHAGQRAGAPGDLRL